GLGRGRTRRGRVRHVRLADALPRRRRSVRVDDDAAVPRPGAGRGVAARGGPGGGRRARSRLRAGTRLAVSRPPAGRGDLSTMPDYAMMYRFGLTPWERYGRVQRAAFDAAFDRETAERAG